MALRLLHTFAVDPVGVSRALPGHIRMQLKGNPDYPVDEDWERHLHGLLGAPWPCPESGRADELVAEIQSRLAAQGLDYGRYTYGGYSDADTSLSRAVWCTVRHTRAEAVIETGVARGITSRIVLEAMRENQRGHLWSIDLPHPFDHQLHTQTGAAVTDACRARWTYIEGSSSQRLPELIASLGHLDLFIHDSLHTAKNTLFEMGQAASVMRHGVMLVDDISTHRGFSAFARREPRYQTIVGPSADRKGLFGIAVNRAEELARPGGPVSGGSLPS
jgi:hypothetical protein